MARKKRVAQKSRVKGSKSNYTKAYVRATNKKLATNKLKRK